jgi:hypothetical protein
LFDQVGAKVLQVAQSHRPQTPEGQVLGLVQEVTPHDLAQGSKGVEDTSTPWVTPKRDHQSGIGPSVPVLEGQPDLTGLHEDLAQPDNLGQFSARPGSHLRENKPDIYPPHVELAFHHLGTTSEGPCPVFNPHPPVVAG